MKLYDDVIDISKLEEDIQQAEKLNSSLLVELGLVKREREEALLLLDCFKQSVEACVGSGTGARNLIRQEAKNIYKARKSGGKT